MSLDNFALHPRLAADTLVIGDLPMCRVLLMNNSTFPWLILVPRRTGKTELFDLEPNDYKLVMDEVRVVTEAFSKHTKADKMNVATLGNQVPQLHIHVIARFENDQAWPNPVWNAEGIDAKAYAPQDGTQKTTEIGALLPLL
ncbi:MAG: HIT domain-containing protein [Rickettsiales bacterium]